MRHYLVGALFALALFGGLTVGAGIFDNEWPDAIMCKIEGKEGAERQVILQLAWSWPDWCGKVKWRILPVVGSG
jgi:hypothetical protein